MIVNVNPYDTGYDENSHVMKFAALAREVYVNPAPAPVQRAPMVGPGKTTGKIIKTLGPMTLNDPEMAPKPFTRKVTISMDGNNNGRKYSEAVLEVLEGQFRLFVCFQIVLTKSIQCLNRRTKWATKTKRMIIPLIPLWMLCSMRLSISAYR